MRNFQNRKFIRTKISTILYYYMERISNVSNSFAFCSISDFILDSIFLKLAGTQEQKFKCMLWEWGCIDLDIRKHLLKDYPDEEKKKSYPEMEKNYSKISEKIDFLQKMFNSWCEISKNKAKEDLKRLREEIIEYTCDDMKKSFKDTKSFYCKTNMFKKYWNESYAFINEKDLLLGLDNMNKLQFFSFDLVENCYKKLYRHRNDIAHNMFVYQNSYPTLEELSHVNENDNIFKWIQILLIIDELSIYFFNKLERL